MKKLILFLALCAVVFFAEYVRATSSAVRILHAKQMTLKG